MRILTSLRARFLFPDENKVMDQHVRLLRISIPKLNDDGARLSSQALRRQWQVDLCESETSEVYMTSSWAVRAT